MTALAPPPATAQVRAPRVLREDIQGLRGLAVGLVVLYHAKLPFVSGGYAGVDVFFVISGFLITQHLAESLERTGRIGFGSFYARRARRLLPAAVVVILLTVLAALLWLPPLQLRAVFVEAGASLLYVPNVLLAANGTSYLAETTPSMFQQYWSLGVEEQFYLVWPAFLLLVWRFTRSRRTLLIILAALVALSLAASVVLTTVNQPLAFFLLPTRAWEFGVGALVALGVARLPRPGARAAALAGWVGLALVAVAAVAYGDATLYPGYAALAPVVGTALVIAVGTGAATQRANPVVTWRPLRWVGDISYSLYLVHWPLLVLPQAAVGQAHPLPWWVTGLLALACLPAAMLLHRHVERRFIGLPWLARARPRRTLTGVLVLSVLVTAVLAGGLALTSRTVLATSSAAPATTVTDPPVATPFVPSNLRPGLRDVEDDVPVLYDDGCHLDFDQTKADGCSFGPAGAPTVALFGDSHAAQWFPALEKITQDHGVRLETYTKSSCPSVSVASQRNGSAYTACTRWREAVLQRLVAHPPALVLLANFGAPASSGPAPTAGWEAGMAETVRRLQPVTRVAVVTDTPNLQQTPSICLSAHLTDAEACGASRQVALDSPARAAERAALAGTGAVPVDLTGYLCTASSCPPIIGDTLVYRDAHHITATFSRELSGALWERLSPVLAGAR